MALQPESETVKRLLSVLDSWLSVPHNYPAFNKLTRLLCMYASKVRNVDEFILALHAQSVLDDTPLTLVQRIPETMARVQHAIEVSMGKRCAKELVVALEWSENESLLTQVLNWAEKEPNKSKDSAEKLSSVDLAPERVPKRKQLSELTPGTVTPRHREINWEGEEKYCTALEVCNNKIIVGWSNGQIASYNSTYLNCQTVLNYCGSQAGVTCLQCAGAEIIAGYKDGNICVWNVVEDGILQHQLSVRNEIKGDRDYATCMRWRGTKLVVCTKGSRIRIWQYVNSSFTLLGSWDTNYGDIIAVDFNKSCVILEPYDTLDPIYVHYFNGQRFRSFPGTVQVNCMAVMHDDFLITSGDDGTLQLLNIRTGDRLTELKGHKACVYTVDTRDGVIASHDDGGRTIIWSVQAQVEGRQAQLASFTAPNFDPDAGGDLDEIKLGTNFMVATSCGSESRRVVVVTDFPL